MQEQIKKDFEELRSITNRGLELLSDAREILDNGLSEDIKKKIESERIDFDSVFNPGFKKYNRG